jgi:hypothetical protein
MSPDVVSQDTDLGQRQVNMPPQTRPTTRGAIPSREPLSQGGTTASEIDGNPF